MIDELFTLLEKSESKLVTEHNFYAEGNFNTPKPMHPEYAATFDVKEYKVIGVSVLRLNLGTIRTGNHPTLISLGAGGNPTAHTHPPEGWENNLYEKRIDPRDKRPYFASINKDTGGPSPQDYSSQQSRKNSGRYYDVIIAKDYIFLYRMNGDDIKIPTAFFKK